MRVNRSSDGGFSMIELLVVMIVIAILAVIAIPIYTTVQISARDSSVKSDLVQAKTIMVAAFTKDGTYPTTITALKTAGFKPGSASIPGYTVNWQLFNVSDRGFCLRAWADTDGARDLWVSAESGVVGPIAVSATTDRPKGCEGITS
jgi:type IV pilus assembly protein PilA